MGRGEILKAINLKLKGYYLVLVHPAIHVNTKEAYAGLTPKQPSIKLADAIKKPVINWRDEIVNDFEETIFENHPKIGKIKEQLYEYGAVYASMTGSGSAVYGIFKGKVKLKNRFPSFFVYEGWL